MKKKVKNCQIDDLCVKHNWYNSGNDDLKKKNLPINALSHIKAGVNVHVQQCVKNHKKMLPVMKKHQH